MDMTRHDDQRSFRIMGSDDATLVSARWSTRSGLSHPAEVDMLTYMPRPGPPRPSQTLIRGTGRSGRFHGEVVIDSTEPFAQELREAGWRPQVWQDFTTLEAVFFEDMA
ncbi:MAG: hypothetical protein ACI9K2_003973 [Myxococcota bacterium]